MPDEITSTGLVVKDLATIITELEDGLKEIYGDDINVDQNSPDGQLINIFAQASVDLRELAVQINNGFNPDLAVGRILDQRVVINDIIRLGGTFTIQPITLIMDRTVSLKGLDDEFNEINGTGFTVQDDEGNEFILVDSETFVAGTYSRNFRARQIGEVTTTVGTIVNPVTIVLGVTSINNPSGALTVGQNEERDDQLRVRRQKSVALNSTGYLNGLLAKILNLTGVTEAVVYENVTNSVDGDGIPAHGIWLVVEGGANTDIADIIYATKSFGCDMKGSVAIAITTPSDATFTAKFDRPTATDLYIQFEVQPIVASPTFDEDAIKEYIVANLTYQIGRFAETSLITQIARDALAATGGEGVPVNVEISDDDITYVDYLDAPTLDAQWVIDETRITITIL